MLTQHQYLAQAIDSPAWEAYRAANGFAGSQETLDRACSGEHAAILEVRMHIARCAAGDDGLSRDGSTSEARLDAARSIVRQWPVETASTYILTSLGNVLRLLEDRPEHAIEKLFPEADEQYQWQWRQRSPARFWYHLDSENRCRLVGIANARYLETS